MGETMEIITTTADGNMSLPQLQSAIRFKEARSYQLKSIEIDGKNNKIVFDELEIGEIPDDVIIGFQAIQPGSKLVLGPCSALVSGKAKTIYIFR